MKTIYEIKGYKNRNHYLRCVSEDYGVDDDIVFALADMLGPSEDFDGLINAIQDF